jgi:hypothetical protein
MERKESDGANLPWRWMPGEVIRRDASTVFFKIKLVGRRKLKKVQNDSSGQAYECE